METVGAWAFALCAAGVACSLLQLMAPSTPASKLLRMAVGTFLLCSLFAPVLLPRSRIHFDLQLEESRARSQEIAQILEGQMAEDVRHSTETALEEEIQKMLAQEGVTAQKIICTVNTLADGRIELYGVEIIVDETQRPRETEIAALVENVYHLRAVIRYR